MESSKKLIRGIQSKAIHQTYLLSFFISPSSDESFFDLFFITQGYCPAEKPSPPQTFSSGYPPMRD
jgi:hypothetical protein